MNPIIIVIADRLSLSPTLVQIRLWDYLGTSLQSLSHQSLVGRHRDPFSLSFILDRRQLLEDESQVISVHVGNR